MSVNQLLKLINAETLLDHFPTSLIFEKLELGINVTRIECPAKNNESNIHDCVFKKFKDDNFITTGIHKNKHYLFVNDDKIRCMNPNLAIFNEIGKNVNKSKLTHIYDRHYTTSHDLAANNHINIDNWLPCQYNEQVLQSVGCTRPLYLSNGISILSTVDRLDEYDLTSMLIIYNWDTWITFMAILFILISISSIKTTLWNSFWSFINPLFDQENPHALKSLTYIFYLLALIPFLEIMRNELLVKLVAVKEKSCNTIDDLMYPNVRVYNFINMNYINRFDKIVEDARLRQKLDKLFNKIGKSTDISDWLKLIQNPEEIKRVGRNYAVIQNEHYMSWIQKSFSRHGKVHRGSQNFLPRLISDFCYKKSFKWKIFGEKMSLRFFETGLHDFISEAAVNFNVRITVQLQRFLQESDPDMLESIYSLIKDQSKDVRNVTSLTIHDLKFALTLYAYSLCLCALILIFECSIFFIDCLMRR